VIRRCANLAAPRRSVLALALSAGVTSSCLIHIDDVDATSHAPPKPGSCGLALPAFCETFDSASPGGRGGDLDEVRWSVARTTRNQAPNVSQHDYVTWTPPGLSPCGRTLALDAVEKGIAVCGEGASSHAEEAAINLQLIALRARQPFDFAARTGTVAFDVDAKTEDSLEVWITDAPAPGAHDGTLPNNGLGFVFKSANCDGSMPATALSDLLVVANGVKATAPTISNLNCFHTSDGAWNHVEIQIGRSLIEIFASNAGDLSTKHSVAQIFDVTLPLTRGYVSFEHVAGPSGASLARWDNVAFDGPFLPMPRGYDVPDSVDVSGEEVSIGYALSPSHRLLLQGVDTSGATAARIDLDVFGPPGAKLSYRLNGDQGHAWHDLPDATDGVTPTAVGFAVDLAELVPNSNTLDLQADLAPPQNSSVVFNVGLTIDAP
jgi:hypothetical protein